MRLKSLELTNFKGVKSFKMTPDGKNTSVFGENATGKTSLADAISWLLYDQDSTGASLLPKPLEPSGEAYHGVCSDVSALFSLNGNGDELTLKKSFYEKWTKRHGEAKKAFTGHTTDYWLDGVPVKKKDFDKKIEEIASETILKLLTSTDYFSERLHWQDRRQILMDICGDITDEDIIKSNPALSRIPEILNNKTFDDRKKIILSQKTTLNKQLTELPVRIDEVGKGLPDIKGLNSKAIDKEIADLTTKISLKAEEVARIKNGGEIAEKTKKQRTIEAGLIEIENQVAEIRNKAAEIQRRQISDIEDARKVEEDAHGRMCLSIAKRNSENEAAEKEVIKLRAEWDAINARTFDDKATICPTCGQSYPEDKSEQIKAKFNSGKAKELVGINRDGKSLVTAIADRTGQIALDLIEAGHFQEKAKELTAKIDMLKSQVIPTAAPTVQEEAYKKDLEIIKAEIESLKSGTTEALAKVEAEIKALEAEKDFEVEPKQRALKDHERGHVRIKELSDQQKICAVEFERLEEMLFIMDEFLKAKVGLLESKVNSKFKMARFKLFNILINGALDPCCETIYQGIPWSAGLNNSARINVGLDIINTLSEHFKIQLPVFIDNAESVCQIIPSESQIIRLVVDPEYKELTVG